MRSVFAISLVILTQPLRPVAAEQLSHKELAAARKLSLTKCTKCHKFYDPLDYTERDWTVWMEKMKRKSRLKADQYQLLVRYFDAVRETGRAEGR
jgi:hypothetical protein